METTIISSFKNSGKESFNFRNGDAKRHGYTKTSFLRQGDQITISTKIANLSDKDLSGQAKLILTDAVSGEDITSLLVSSSAVENFTINKDNNTQVSWQLSIPDTVNAVQYKIVAKAGDFSDGEQNTLQF